MGRIRSMTVAAATAACLVVGTATHGRAEENQFARDFGLGMGAVGVNIFYMPAKFVYATLGAITGGFAYVLTGANLKNAKAVWTPTLGGTYVVTPSMLRGDDRILFSGETEARSATVRVRDEGAAPAGTPSEPYQGY